jgi:DNA modification methylase
VSWSVLEGDALTVLSSLPEQSAQTCVTSPPYYGLRDYGHEGQLGLEATPQEYVERLVAVFREVRRVLRDDGTLWLNIGDSYASYRDGKATPDTTRGESTGTLVPKGSAKNRTAATFAGTGIKHKDLIGIPWMLAFAMRSDGWYLRSDIIWQKPNPMPESVKDRPTSSYEHVFLFSKQERYYYDADAIREAQSPNTAVEIASRKNLHNKGTFGGERPDLARSRTDYVPEDGKRNARNVWSVNTKPFSGAHFAVFPVKLVEPCVLAGSHCVSVARPEIKSGQSTVLDPFTGSGTTGVAALRCDRHFVGVELNPEYAVLARNRIRDDAPLMNASAEVAA